MPSAPGVRGGRGEVLGGTRRAEQGLQGVDARAVGRARGGLRAAGNGTDRGWHHAHPLAARAEGGAGPREDAREGRGLRAGRRVVLHGVVPDIPRGVRPRRGTPAAAPGARQVHYGRFLVHPSRG